MGQILEWQLGFNIWANRTSVDRTASGISPVLLISLVDGAAGLAPSHFILLAVVLQILF